MVEEQQKLWVTQAADGDETAFSHLYRDYAGKLYSYFRVRIQNEEALQDLVQETFVAMWRSCRQYTQSSSVATWVFGIARHKLLSFLRSKYRQPVCEPMTDESLLELVGSGTDDFTESVITEDMMRVAARALSAEARELMHLVFVAELSYNEISQILGIPPGTVKSRVYHLRTALKKELQTER